MSELFYKDGEAKTFKRFCSERLCSECELYADANGDCQRAYTIVLEKEIREDERKKFAEWLDKNEHLFCHWKEGNETNVECVLREWTEGIEGGREK